jgi:hypothetical protein
VVRSKTREDQMLIKYKEYMESLATKVRENGPEHSVRLTVQADGCILEVFSNTAFDGLAESLFMTADAKGMSVCLENNLCAMELSLKKFLLSDFNDNAQAVIHATSEQVKSYMPGLTL